MKSTYYIIYVFTLFLLGAFASCTNDGGTTYGSVEETDSEEALLNDGPITHNLDTSVGYCFQLGEAGIEETLEIELIGNYLRGRGIRVEVGTQTKYELILKGKINGNEADMTIGATNMKDATDGYNHTETWVLSEEILTVKNRQIQGMKGSFKYYRTKCYFYENKDTTRYDSFLGFSEGYAVVSKNGFYGLINEAWEETIPLKYRDLGIVNEGSIMYYDHEKARSGLLDVNGNILVEAQYSEIHCYNEGLAAFLDDDGKWGFMDKNQKVVIKPKYSNINFYKPDPSRHPFNEGLANVQNTDGRWDYIDRTGKVVINGKFLFTKHFVNGAAEVYKDNKWYTINKSGNCIKNCD